MNSGIYIRVGKENILLEQLEDKDLLEFINTLDKDGLKRTIFILCEVLRNIEIEFDLIDK